MSELGGILSGFEIIEQIERGNIKVEPDYYTSCVNPASLDLRLGSTVAVYRNSIYFVFNGKAFYEADDGSYRSHEGIALPTSVPFDKAMAPHYDCVLDTRRKYEVQTFEMNPQRGWLLKPGIGYLMHTAEKICTDKFVPVLDGKSSLGRLFMTAHVTAGYGDPGFDGQYTLEVVVTHPVIVYPGMRFCQIRFHTMVGQHRSYAKAGHYTGVAASGPVPSMSWKQFDE